MERAGRQESGAQRVDVAGALGRAVDWTSDLFGYLAALLLVVTSVIITYEVTVRKLGYPTSWTFDISNWFQLTIIFFGLAYTQRVRANIQVDLFTRHLRVRRQVQIRVFAFVVGIVMVLIMGWEGLAVTVDAVQTNQMTREMTRIPVWWTTWPIPLGSLILAFQLARQIIWDLAWLRYGTGGTLEELGLLSQEELELRAALREG